MGSSRIAGSTRTDFSRRKRHFTKCASSRAALSMRWQPGLPFRAYGSLEPASLFRNAKIPTYVGGISAEANEPASEIS